MSKVEKSSSQWYLQCKIHHNTDVYSVQ